MKITNNANLPMPFVRMAQEEYEFKPKRYSVTTLLDPTRKILLNRRHNAEIEQDCSDMVWLLFGKAVHSILEENSDGANEFAEEKLAVELENGYTVSGKIDLYDIDKAEVVDYKTASVWKVIKGDFEDWRLQGLMYVWLLRKNGLPCETVTFYAILKDHSKRDAKTKADYPKSPVYKVEFEVTDGSIAEIDEYILAKIDELRKYEEVEDLHLPLCTDEERWNDGDKYAVMKKGRKTALRVLDTLDEAEKYKAEKGGDYIETRHGEDKRCVDYCLCCKHCDYWKENYGEVNNEEQTTSD